MPKLMKIANKNDVPDGEVKGFSLQGISILIANIGGIFYAMDSVCPHAHAPLEDGDINGTHIRCPWHGSEFDLETGACTSGPAVLNQRVYNVRIEEGAINIEVDHRS
ncbi:MAG: non-heme iron oxygenase ferredoxin subunit [Thermoplasmataceae archaeon]